MGPLKVIMIVLCNETFKRAIDPEKQGVETFKVVGFHRCEG